jgi:hypothetical protein
VGETDLFTHFQTLERRVRQLEDESEIRALLCRHDYYFDCMNDDEWLALWVADGAFDLVSIANYPDGSRRELVQRYAGIDELREFVKHPEGHHREGFYGHSMHCASNNLMIGADGDEAWATSYSLLYQESEDKVHLLSGANNYWRLRRVDGRWRLQERRRRQVGSPAFARNLGVVKL